MRSIRIGISRLRDELEAAAGRPVQEITPTTSAIEPHTSVFVGTEAVLHRIDRADVVVFLDIDAELLAPRFRASEQALSLVAHGARLVTGGSVSGEVVLQTSVPQHEVMVGLVTADLAPHVAAETERRQRLRLPPFGALAEISGAGAADLAAQLATSLLVQVATSEDRTLVRAASWEALSEALTVALGAVGRPKVRVRIAVDPSRA
jgi:primosomal protein N' (replication factor Y)